MSATSPTLSQSFTVEEARETRLFKRLVYVSLAVHVLFLVFDPSFWMFRPTGVDEMVVEAELLDLEDIAQDKPDSIKDAKVAEELSINENALPQLTKKFALDEKIVDKDSLVDPDKVDIPIPVPEEPKPTAATSVPTPEDESIKKIALERILKEKARLEKKTAKEHMSPLNAVLLKRKEDLKHLQSTGYSLSSLNTGYASTLKRWISRRYTLPDIYNYADASLKASVQVVLGMDGNLEKISLYESSHDSVFDSLVLKTIQDSAPFPAPPREWVGKVITFPFEPGKKRL